jgi:flagellar assembly factor FliW
VLGIDLLCLALLATSGRSVQANLTAPIVINLHNSRGVQSVQRATETATCYRLEENGSWGRQC